jgi:DNA-binding Xre family transcriptional regulator
MIGIRRFFVAKWQKIAQKTMLDLCHWLKCDTKDLSFQNILEIKYNPCMPLDF